MKSKTQTIGTAQVPTGSSVNWPLILSLASIVLVPVLFMAPLLFQGKTFPASDTQQWLGTAKALVDYHEATGSLPLWTPNVFGGMPGYMISLPNPIPGFDSIILSSLGLISDWRVVYLVFMGIGAFLFSRRFTDNEWLSAMAAVAFQLSTYFIIILKVGHNTKFQAIAYLPWILLAFDFLIRSGGWKGGLALALGLSLQLRANHPQITYYTLIVLLIWGLFWLVDEIRNGRIKPMLQTIGWAAAGGLIAVMTIAFPYLINADYSQYTIRAGTLASGAAGLTRDYALAWSFDWVESVTFFVADFFGGHSPYYWWQMPFTEGPQYLGAILLFLAGLTFLVPLTRTVLMLWIVTGVTWLLAMGSNFPFLADLALNALPFYNKFRTPSMILVILSLTIPVLAVLGVQGFLKAIAANRRTDELLKRFYLLSGLVIGFGVVLLIVSGSMGFIRPEEAQQYDARTLDYLKGERSALTTDSIWKFLILNVVAIGLVWLAATSRLKAGMVGFGLFLLLLTDLWTYNSQYVSKEVMVSKRQFSAGFPQSPVDRFLLEDTTDFRIYPVGNLYQSTRFNYYHQSIGGYHGAKLAVFQNLIDSSLSVSTGPIPFNSGTLKAFGVKYLVIPQAINQPIGTLLPSFVDPAGKQSVMETTTFGGKAFFVKKVNRLDDPTLHVREMNRDGWDPEQLSFVAGYQPSADLSWDSSATIRQVKREHHELAWQVSTPVSSFLFLSEIWYPSGWRATLDGKEIPLYQTNHAFRGVEIPAGSHELVLTFDPPAVTASLTAGWIGTAILYGGLLLWGFLLVRKRKDA
ncbi:MAG: YfhO family protein [Bacteroidetes bacterium]|nr:YfhO family protein [Bacteroidota bacterium]